MRSKPFVGLKVSSHLLFVVARGKFVIDLSKHKGCGQIPSNLKVLVDDYKAI